MHTLVWRWDADTVTRSAHTASQRWPWLPDDQRQPCVQRAAMPHRLLRAPVGCVLAMHDVVWGCRHQDALARDRLPCPLRWQASFTESPRGTLWCRSRSSDEAVLPRELHTAALPWSLETLACRTLKVSSRCNDLWTGPSVPQSAHQRLISGMSEILM